ncbi:hypothetical protein [Nocardioides perillae]|uniref:Uncharacterized protein n=1 Tax=Nocardioides perillae TaxID=1119534 RepID=A0A7Y9RV69_9ACTN|nr:hypothetical protein [Nocardioides perillae]NYG55951.1 hypothetical protein [Nocardioides perillae]
MALTRTRRAVVRAASVVLVGVLGAWLSMRNLSAFDVQPSMGAIAYRAVTSAALFMPTLLLAVSAYRATDTVRAGDRLGLFAAWFLVAFILSSLLGI